MRITALTMGLLTTGLTLAASSQPIATSTVLTVGSRDYALGSLNITSDLVEQNTVQDSAVEESPKPTKKAVGKRKAVYVTVKKGDTLQKIAQENKTSSQRLFNANVKLKHPDLIKPGDKVRIPHESEKLATRTLPKPEPRKVVSAPAKKQTVSSSHLTTSAPAIASGSVWDRLAACESGGNWSINTGNGYYGGLQFTLATWRAVGGSGYPHQNSREEQIKRGQILQSRSGWGQWPQCAAKLGLL